MRCGAIFFVVMLRTHRLLLMSDSWDLTAVRLQPLLLTNSYCVFQIYQATACKPAGGCFYPPTLITKVQTVSRVVQEEVKLLLFFPNLIITRWFVCFLKRGHLAVPFTGPPNPESCWSDRSWKLRSSILQWALSTTST